MWMTSSLVDLAIWLGRVTCGCQSQSCNSPGFEPSISRHSRIWGATGEAVLNNLKNIFIFPWTCTYCSTNTIYSRNQSATQNFYTASAPLDQIRQYWYTDYQGQRQQHKTIKHSSVTASTYPARSIHHLNLQTKHIQKYPYHRYTI